MTTLPEKTLRQIELNRLRICTGICPKTRQACSFNRSANRCCEDEGRGEIPQPNTFPVEEFDGDEPPEMEAA